MNQRKLFTTLLFIIFLTLTLTLFLFFTQITLISAETVVSRDGIDAILVIDTSGSMVYADHERTALEAAVLFIDMLETRNSRVGVVEFSGDLGTVIPFTPVNTPDERDALRAAILGFRYHGWTDIGAALRRAAEMMDEQGDPDNSPMILLFTDGRIELAPWQTTRTAEMSYADVETALEILGGETPVYTIGLNYDGTVDVDFLRSIADRTLAQSHIVTEATALPQIFSGIFASHIRSSITEIAEFVTEGDQYTDVLIPIPSAFVAEANIIMLSESPLLNVRLLNPYGNEVQFDDTNYSLSYANRYSMIKLINPQVGEWVVSVRGIPHERVTVNLIYNFDVNISLSVSQEQVANQLYDPRLPVTVTAQLLVADPRMELYELYGNGTRAELQVFNQSMQLLYTVPMYNNGNSFTVNYMTQTGEDVHLSVQVTHPAFETGSALITVSYFVPDPEQEPPPPPESPPEPLPTPTPAPPTPEPEPSYESNDVPWVPMAAGAAGVGVCALAAYLIIKNQKKPTRLFDGCFQIRALLENGDYTKLEAPDLSTCVGPVAFDRLLNEVLTSRVDNHKLLDAVNAVDVGKILLAPDFFEGEPALSVNNKGSCEITMDGLAQPKNFIWTNGQRLILCHNPITKLEITYLSRSD